MIVIATIGFLKFSARKSLVIAMRKPCKEDIHRLGPKGPTVSTTDACFPDEIDFSQKQCD